jgi:hypothetical protein
MREQMDDLLRAGRRRATQAIEVGWDARPGMSWYRSDLGRVNTTSITQMRPNIARKITVRKDFALNCPGAAG